VHYRAARIARHRVVPFCVAVRAECYEVPQRITSAFASRFLVVDVDASVYRTAILTLSIIPL